MRRGTELSVDEIVAVLEEGATRRLSPRQPLTQLEHALQTAAILRRGQPDDAELAVAGLVHDLGQLLRGARDETHAADGNYKVELAGDSVASLGRQGGALAPSGAAGFLARAWAGDAVTLRRADDQGKVDNMGVENLENWVPLLRRVTHLG